MTVFPVEGGCHCGAIRYSLAAPAISVQHCHCSRCRKSSGQLSNTGAVVRRADMTIRGEENLTTYYSSASFYGQFCRTCGCHLFSYEISEPVLMYFFPATLDGGVHPGHPPNKESHIYVGSKAEWDRIPDGVAKFEEVSPDEIVTQVQRL